VKNFGISAVKAFADAERQAIVLRNAVKDMPGAFERLGAQAEKLSGQLGIDDDTFTQMQAFLAQQGLTEKQITKTVEAAAKLSAVTGQDLNTAVMTLSATYEGNVGRLGKLDSGFKTLTQTQLENGGAIDLINTKYADALETMEGTTQSALGRIDVWWGNFKESVGGVIVHTIDGWGAAFKRWGIIASETSNEVEDLEKQISGEALPKSTADLEKFIVAKKEEYRLQLITRRARQESGKMSAEEEKQSWARVHGLQTLIDSAKEQIELNKKMAAEEAKKLQSDPKYIANQKAIADALEKTAEAAKHLDDIRTSLATGGTPSLFMTDKELDALLSGETHEAIQQVSADIDSLPTLGGEQNFELILNNAEKFKKFMVDNIDTIVASILLIGEAFNAVGQIVSDQYAQQNKEAQHSADEQLAALEKRNTEGQLSDRAYAREKERIQKDLAKKEFELRLKQAKLDKAMSIFNIGLKIAETIATYLSNPVTAPGLPFALASEGIALAAAIAKPLPKYHTGKKAQINSAKEVHAIIRTDEDVIAPDKSKEFRNVLDSIHGGKRDYEKFILNTYLKPDRQRRENNLSDSFAKNVAQSIALDTYNMERAIRKNGTVKLDPSTIEALGKSLNNSKNVRNGS
jgi:hypothetical protein